MDYPAFLQALEGEGLPPVLLLHGPEPRLLEEALARATRALFPDPALLTWGREVFDARDTPPEAVVRAALTLAPLAPARLVAVRGAQAFAQRQAEALLRYCREPNRSTRLLLLADGPLPPAHWLLQAVGPRAVVEVRRPAGRALVAWLQERARERGHELSEPAAQLLLGWAGEDLATLEGEIEKAALFQGTPLIDEDAVRQVAGAHRLSRAFELTDALESRNPGAALPLLEGLLAQGEEPLALLGIVARQVRLAWQVRQWNLAGKPPEEIARSLRRPPYVAETLAARAAALPPHWAPRALARCWEAERRLKSGGEPRAELALLVLDLCRAG
jgi:DNA polymerase-3 subunit delta